MRESTYRPKWHRVILPQIISDWHRCWQPTAWQNRYRQCLGFLHSGGPRRTMMKEDDDDENVTMASESRIQGPKYQPVGVQTLSPSCSPSKCSTSHTFSPTNSYPSPRRCLNPTSRDLPTPWSPKCLLIGVYHVYPWRWSASSFLRQMFIVTANSWTEFKDTYGKLRGKIEAVKWMAIP